MTVYGYLRVSTDKQDCDNQKIGVEALAKKLIKKILLRVFYFYNILLFVVFFRKSCKT